MKITMAELNKNVNSIINRSSESGETVTIFKHGKPIAKILPVNERESAEHALRYLISIEPVTVTDTIESVINKGRQRGI